MSNSKKQTTTSPSELGFNPSEPWEFLAFTETRADYGKGMRRFHARAPRRLLSLVSRYPQAKKWLVFKWAPDAATTGRALVARMVTALDPLPLHAVVMELEEWDKRNASS